MTCQAVRDGPQIYELVPELPTSRGWTEGGCGHCRSQPFRECCRRQRVLAEQCVVDKFADPSQRCGKVPVAFSQRLKLMMFTPGPEAPSLVPNLVVPLVRGT